MNLTEAEEDVWELKLGGKIAITVILGCIVLVGVIGNVLVITLITMVRKMNSTVNMCLASLAVADLVILVFAPILPLRNLYDADHSNLGINFCKYFRLSPSVLMHILVVYIGVY